MTRIAAFIICLFWVAAAEAKPYRAMVTRTARRVPNGMLELGLRYQGFVGGIGRDDGGVLREPRPYHQLAGSARWWILPRLEAEVQLEALLVDHPWKFGGSTVYFGDIPVGVQFTFLDSTKFSAALFGRVTIPTGPSFFDSVPPNLSDGTLDGELTFIGELRPTQRIRLLINLGYLHHGVRDRGGLPDFDVPDAVRYDLALAFNVSERLLLALELVGRSYFDEHITPQWDDNQHQLEVMPGLRFELSPGLVLEGAIGVSVTRDLREIYQWRGLLGLTYEFDF